MWPQARSTPWWLEPPTCKDGCKVSGFTPPSFWKIPLITVPKGADILEAEEDLRLKLIALLDKVQKDYPDSHQGQWWAPARLGGTAMSLEEAEIEGARVREARLAKLEMKKQKKEKK